MLPSAAGHSILHRRSTPEKLWARALLVIADRVYTCYPRSASEAKQLMCTIATAWPLTSVWQLKVFCLQACIVWQGPKSGCGTGDHHFKNLRMQSALGANGDMTHAGPVQHLIITHTHIVRSSVNCGTPGAQTKCQSPEPRIYNLAPFSWLRPRPSFASSSSKHMTAHSAGYQWQQGWMSELSYNESDCSDNSCDSDSDSLARSILLDVISSGLLPRKLLPRLGVAELLCLKQVNAALRQLMAAVSDEAWKAAARDSVPLSHYLAKAGDIHTAISQYCATRQAIYAQEIATR